MLPEIITTDFTCSSPENQYLDRKSAKIKLADIAKHIVALAIGVEDNGEVTGFDYSGVKNINKFRDVPFSMCSGNISFDCEEKL